MSVLVSAQALVGTLRPLSMKRSACDAIGPDELRAMLHEAKRAVSTFGAPLARAGAVSAGMQFQRAAEAHADWAS